MTSAFRLVWQPSPLVHSFFPLPGVIRCERCNVYNGREKYGLPGTGGEVLDTARLTDLVNIGQVTAELLIEVEISTPQELQAVGPVVAWRRIRARHPERATLACLYALQGALLGIPGKALPEAIIEELLDQLQSDG